MWRRGVNSTRIFNDQFYSSSAFSAPLPEWLMVITREADMFEYVVFRWKLLIFNLTHVVGSILRKPCFLGNVSESCGWFGLGGNSVINSSHVGLLVAWPFVCAQMLLQISCRAIFGERKSKGEISTKTWNAHCPCLSSSMYWRSVSNCENSINYNINRLIEWEVNIKMLRENSNIKFIVMTILLVRCSIHMQELLVSQSAWFLGTSKRRRGKRAVWRFPAQLVSTVPTGSHQFLRCRGITNRLRIQAIINSALICASTDVFEKNKSIRRTIIQKGNNYWAYITQAEST